MRRRVLMLLVPLVAITAAVTLGEPLFESNDDTGLAMLGAGFGIAAAPEAHLIFAHYGYGLLLQVVRWVAGNNAHGWTTLAAISISMALSLRAVFATAASPLLLAAAATTLVCGVFVRPLLDPQFTLTSSLLLGSAIACRIALLPGVNPATLAAIYGAVLLGFLIRPSSAVLVLVVAGPAILWLAWQGPSAQRSSLRRFIVALSAIAVLSLVTDQAAYSLSSDWSDALTYNRLRSVFNDFFRMPWEGHEAAYRHVGWSANDRAMFLDWYSLHPIYDLANVRYLVDAVAISGPWLKPEGIWPWFAAIPTMPVAGLLAIATLALGIAARRERVVVLLIASGCLAALVISGVTGRPPQFRVMFSIFAAAFLVMLPFAARAPWRGLWTLSSGAAILAATLSSAVLATELHRERVADATAYRALISTEGLRYFEGPLVSWGAALMWEWLITPTRIYAPIAGKTIPSIGLFTRMPVMRASLDKAGIADLGETLCRRQNVRLVADNSFVMRLQQFCTEHYGMTPQYREVFKAARSAIFEPGPSQASQTSGDAANGMR